MAHKALEDSEHLTISWPNDPRGDAGQLLLVERSVCEKLHFPRMHVIIGPNDLQRAGSLRFEECGRSLRPQLAHDLPDILTRGGINQIFGPRIGTQYGWDDLLQHLVDIGGLHRVLAHQRHRRPHRAASFMAHHHDQRDAQIADCEFEATERRRAQCISGVSNDEQFTYCLLYTSDAADE